MIDLSLFAISISRNATYLWRYYACYPTRSSTCWNHRRNLLDVYCVRLRLRCLDRSYIAEEEEVNLCYIHDDSIQDSPEHRAFIAESYMACVFCLVLSAEHTRWLFAAVFRYMAFIACSGLLDTNQPSFVLPASKCSARFPQGYFSKDVASLIRNCIRNWILLAGTFIKISVFVSNSVD